MTAILELQQISFWRGSKTIVNSMNVSFEAGRFIGLIGPNGTGKSTLLRLMAKLLKPHGGNVFLGEEI